MYKEILVDTFDTVFKNSNNLFQKILIPTIIIIIVNYFLPKYFNETPINSINYTNLNLNEILILSVIIFLMIMSNISIAITTHRVSILGEDSVPKFGSLIFGKREFKFLLNSLLFGIILAFPLMMIIFFPKLSIFVVPIILIILISRLSIIFPAIACDEKMGFFKAWKATKNYNILTISMIIIFPLVFSLSVGIIYTIFIEFLTKLISTHLSLLYSILDVFIMVFVISALSSVYKHLRAKPINIIKEPVNTKPKEIKKTSKNGINQIIIDDNYNITFGNLKKELKEQFEALGFTYIAYNRINSWLLINPDDEEAYVSLRHQNNEYVINTKNTKMPQLKLFKNNHK